MLKPFQARPKGDPFLRSVLAQPAAVRLGVVGLVLALLWLAVLWAVALP